MSFESNHPSSGGLGINLDFDPDSKLREQRADLDLMKELLDQGYPTDAAQYIVKKRRDTGVLDLNLPNFKNDLQPGNQPNRPVPLPPVPDIPERSTLENFSPMNQDAIANIDYQNPNKINFLPIPRGTNVKSVIQTDKPKPAGRTDTPEVAAAKETFKSYLKGVADGFVPPDMYKILQSAAPILNLTPEEVPTPDNPVPPTFVQKVFGIKPDQPPPAPPRIIPTFPGRGKGASDMNPELQQDMTDAQTAISKGLVTPTEALHRLRKKHGPKVHLPR